MMTVFLIGVAVGITILLLKRDAEGSKKMNIEIAASRLTEAVRLHAESLAHRLQCKVCEAEQSCDVLARIHKDAATYESMGERYPRRQVAVSTYRQMNESVSNTGIAQVPSL